MNSYRHFTNIDCEYFPCHNIDQQSNNSFNCLFCYCPLYKNMDCGGKYNIFSNGIKDCSNCTIPHFNYDYIIEKIIQEVQP